MKKKMKARSSNSINDERKILEKFMKFIQKQKRMQNNILNSFLRFSKERTYFHINLIKFVFLFLRFFIFYYFGKKLFSFLLITTKWEHIMGFRIYFLV